MVRTNSTMLPIGTKLPNFDLPVVKCTNSSQHQPGFNLDRMSNSSLGEKPSLLMVLCAHCPFVKHIENELTNLEKAYGERIQFIGIASNSLETHPQDGPDQLALQAQLNDWKFPYLLDLDQSFAISLRAACTPDFFLFSDRSNHGPDLIYRGQLDDSRPGNDIPVTGKDLRSALDAVLEGKMPANEQKPSIGCNIKWHPGKEPNWF